MGIKNISLKLNSLETSPPKVSGRYFIFIGTNKEGVFKIEIAVYSTQYKGFDSIARNWCYGDHYKIKNVVYWSEIPEFINTGDK